MNQDSDKELEDLDDDSGNNCINNSAHVEKTEDNSDNGNEMVFVLS